MLGLRWAYRYRLVVEVDDKGVLRSGASVIEIIRDKGYNGIGGKVRGEAVAVDLGDGQVLFALLSGPRGGADWPVVMPHHAFAEQLGGDSMVDEAKLDKLDAMTGASAILQASDYPMLVRFRSIAVPSSVEEVNPKNLGASFGPDVKLKRITVEITDDPVTSGLERRLGWLSGYYDKMLDGQRFNNSLSLANNLSLGSFSTIIKP